MNSSLIVLLVLVIAFASARFSCGQDALQANLAEMLVKNDCKGRLQAIDNCCAAHTKCHKKKQASKADCDSRFCTCAKKASNKLPLCGLQTDNLCNTAKTFGDLLRVLSIYSIDAYNYLITNPTVGFSHVKYNSKIADVLADAGHNVTILQYYHIPMPNLDGLVKNPNVEIIHYYPDNFEELRKAKTATLPEFWATKSMDSPLLGYFVKPAFFASMWNNTYTKLLRDKEFLKTLEARNFDAVLAETFEIGGFYIAHLINARSVIATMPSVRYPYTEQLFGQPATLGYIPGDFSRMGKEATVFDRLNDIYYDFFSTISHKAYADAQQVLYSSIVGYNLPDWKELVTKSTYFFTNTNSYLDFAIPKTQNIIHVGGFTVDKEATYKLPEEYQNIIKENTVIISFGSVVRSYEMPEEFKNGLIKLFRSISKYNIYLEI
ncbi:unnamed protein product [Caenorhabditis angaria]|uniref:glucuronosyltransferase n=1 Tax=Caenorhabditis angaria TaxID=860376 RepID=A0A9P1IV10_9PELO|nr:unnamed protein product [Caenorhabditis angaria]